jgi:hypothetical protein
MKSASINCLSEYVLVQPVIIPELEFGNIQREIFLADFVEGSDHAALQDRPKAFDGLRMDSSDDVLAASMINSGMGVVLGKGIVAPELIGAEQADFRRDGLMHKP